jgi:tRNA pseudouridine55 synthase
MAFDFNSGEILLINKPCGWTSFDAVKKVRNSISRNTGLKKIKVGHAGTLDPLASGLLIICTGKFTKKINEFQDQEKEYMGTFFLGATTPSFDGETEIDQKYDTRHIDEKLINQTAILFEGEQLQAPPTFSAINIKGMRAYHKARNQENFELPPRKINIRKFEITGIDLPIVSFRIACSKGTYIRALARDFGKKLNTGAYLTSLARTRIGNYLLENATAIDEFESMIKSEQNS